MYIFLLFFILFQSSMIALSQCIIWVNLIKSGYKWTDKLTEKTIKLDRIIVGREQVSYSGYSEIGYGLLKDHDQNIATIINVLPYLSPHLSITSAAVFSPPLVDHRHTDNVVVSSFTKLSSKRYTRLEFEFSFGLVLDKHVKSKSLAMIMGS